MNTKIDKNQKRKIKKFRELYKGVEIAIINCVKAVLDFQ